MILVSLSRFPPSVFLAHLLMVEGEWMAVRERGKSACSCASPSFPPSLLSPPPALRTSYVPSLIFLHIPFGCWFACLCLPFLCAAHSVDVFYSSLPSCSFARFTSILLSLPPSLPPSIYSFPPLIIYISFHLFFPLPLPFHSSLPPSFSSSSSSASSQSITACFPATVLHVL